MPSKAEYYKDLEVQQEANIFVVYPPELHKVSIFSLDVRAGS